MDKIRLLEEEIEIARTKINMYNTRIRRIKSCNKDDYRLEYYNKLLEWEIANLGILNNRLEQTKT